jgi:hypothetical protein
MEYVVRIEPDGMSISMLYREDNPLIEGGEVSGLTEGFKMFRASDVRFDEDRQKWYVVIRGENGRGKHTNRFFTKRSEAIAWEIEELERRLSDGFEPAPPKDPYVVQTE